MGELCPRERGARHAQQVAVSRGTGRKSNLVRVSRLPWLADVCEFEGPYTLRTKVEVRHAAVLAEFCRIYLVPELRRREDALWFDHRETPGVTLLPRLPAYLAALFILSNVSRYEPQFLDEPTTGLTNLGYFLNTFLDNAERFVPQLVLELAHGRPLFFE